MKICKLFCGNRIVLGDFDARKICSPLLYNTRYRNASKNVLAKNFCLEMVCCNVDKCNKYAFGCHLYNCSFGKSFLCPSVDQMGRCDLHRERLDGWLARLCHPENRFLDGDLRSDMRDSYGCQSSRKKVVRTRRSCGLFEKKCYEKNVML
jgi:hypothetical protein